MFFTGISFAAPNYVNYQGRFTDAASQALPTGNYSLEFNVYDSATDGTLIWGLFSQTVSVIEGNFKYPHWS
ncbi:MAG: hypothetical protein L7V86_05765 [Verrucomicrobiales bacterium]|nr:hypothetical protein [Verrucomicrobiales bacterium]MDB4772973.1 hypothetical protein [Verrucomicrobiales bacterium]